MLHCPKRRLDPCDPWPQEDTFWIVEQCDLERWYQCSGSSLTFYKWAFQFFGSKGCDYLISSLLKRGQKQNSFCKIIRGTDEDITSLDDSIP